MMKSACAARIERELEQALNYANATYYAHSTGAKSSDFGGQHDSGSHFHMALVAPSPADLYDLGAWQRGDINGNATGFDDTRMVTSSGVYPRDMSNINPYSTLPDTDWVSPSANLSPSSGQPHEALDTFSHSPDASSSYANAERASARTLTRKTAVTSPTAKPPQRRNLHGNWRQRDAAPVTSFRDSVLADIAKEQKQPKQQTLLESLGHSLSDPEPWQVELYQQKSRLISTPTIARYPFVEQAKLQHGLFQELKKKYGDTWPQANYEDDQTVNPSTPTLERHDLPAQGGQDGSTKRKTLLEIYYKAEQETALRKRGPSQWVQFGDRAAVEIPADTLA
ncbi:hypothetical protein ColLi_12267 [Colletotrichum liriopes]|uniref:Uncharacterized protein n=1 Tax=Colletotrichum liriopes TaxID=708192 RepID=A0AA37GY37_9PEZI|nr:hypothetical protein ColLi_12267 [Colletotrichum liriopes]